MHGPAFHYPNKAIVTLIKGSNKPAAASFWGLI